MDLVAEDMSLAMDKNDGDLDFGLVLRWTWPNNTANAREDLVLCLSKP